MISLCIPTFNRTSLLFECFRDLIYDDRVSEIVIVDDHSDMVCYEQVAEYCSHIPKVKLYRNEKNLDCYRNKREAVSKATNDWVIIGDSDNVFTKEYIGALPYKQKENVIVQPCFARPHFDFRRYSGLGIIKENVHQLIDEANFQTMLNAMNFYVNRDEFLRVWDGSVDPVTSDSLYFNYCWLNSGNMIHVSNGVEYEHRVHNGSHYQNNVRRTPKGFHEDIIQRLKNMR